MTPVASCSTEAVAPLLSVPNISEGRDEDVILAIARAFDSRLLDLHTDPDHHRSVLTIAGAPGKLAQAVVDGAREAVKHVDITLHRGEHPRVGVVDVVPIVYLEPADRGAACAEALVLGDRLGDELELPVFLYGDLGAGRTRHEIRRGGPGELAARMAAGELRADFGPEHLHPTAGAVLVSARAPLVAFNLELAPPARLEDARSIAAQIREGGAEGLPGVRAIGAWLDARGTAQVSTNVEDYRAAPLKSVVAAVRRHARIAEAELVGLAPAAALADFPEDVPFRGRATIEDGLVATD